MKPLRTLDRATRRARLIAARPYPIGGIVRRRIIGGQWDRGFSCGGRLTMFVTPRKWFAPIMFLRPGI